MEQVKKVEDVPMMTAKSIGFKKNSMIIAGNYTIKTVDNIFQIRDEEVPLAVPDGGGNNDIVAKTDKSTKQGVVRDTKVKTGDSAFLMINVLFLIAALTIVLILIFTKRFSRDEE
jgi:hypothetical protein